eukprot:gene13462-biopygen4419
MCTTLMASNRQPAPRQGSADAPQSPALLNIDAFPRFLRAIYFPEQTHTRADAAAALAAAGWPSGGTDPHTELCTAPDSGSLPPLRLAATDKSPRWEGSVPRFALGYGVSRSWPGPGPQCLFFLTL